MEEKLDVLEESGFLRQGPTRYDPRRYPVIKKIGFGAHSNVFLVTDKSTDRILVMKVIKKTRGNIKMFEQEISVLKYIQDTCHLYFLCFESAYETDDNYYILTEYLEHYITLEDFIGRVKKRGFESMQQELRNVVSNLIEAVYALHKMEIVHRDLKPANVLVSSVDQSVRLIDFGYACVASPDPKSDVPQCVQIVMGTHDYMAPEIVGKFIRKDAAGVTRRVHNPKMELDEMYPNDLWSLGVIIYALLYPEMNHDTVLAEVGSRLLDRIKRANLKKYEDMVRQDTYFDAIDQYYSTTFRFDDEKGLMRDANITVLERFESLKLPYKFEYLLHWDPKERSQFFA